MRRYGAEDISQYATWFESQVQGMSIGQPHLEMMPNPCVALVHHRDDKREAMVDVASTSTDPLIAPNIGTYDIDEDLRFEARIQDMLNDFFVMFFSKRMWK